MPRDGEGSTKMPDFVMPQSPGEKVEFYRESKDKPRWRKYFLFLRDDGDLTVVKKRYGAPTNDWKPGTSELELAIFLMDSDHPAVKELRALLPEHA